MVIKNNDLGVFSLREKLQPPMRSRGDRDADTRNLRNKFLNHRTCPLLLLSPLTYAGKNFLCYNCYEH